MFEVMTTERIEKGIKRLLAMPGDLRQCGVQLCKTSSNFKGSFAHQTLFNEYKETITGVALVALDWWAEIVEARILEAENRDDAVRGAWRSRPAGPASFPGFVALIRDYWLACHNLNNEVSPDQCVPPETFLVLWLLEENQTDGIKVISCMPYWPIGLDKDGNCV